MTIHLIHKGRSILRFILFTLELEFLFALTEPLKGFSQFIVTSYQGSQLIVFGSFFIIYFPLAVLLLMALTEQIKVVSTCLTKLVK